MARRTIFRESAKDGAEPLYDGLAKLLSDDGSLEFLAETICKRINENNKTNTTTKSLEARKAAAVKSSRNLISAIEEGIITEQTKERLKELESEIARLEFDIEQERQRSFIEITTDKSSAS